MKQRTPSHPALYTVINTHSALKIMNNIGKYPSLTHQTQGESDV